MDWIKRNLYFLVGGAIALALMGMAGFFLYSKWQMNTAEKDKLNADYAELQTLNSADPHPGNDQVNNTKIARAQQDEVRKLIEKAKAKFERIPPIPDLPNPTESDFAAALSRTIDQLQKQATNSSVVIPSNYRFSFEAQYTRVSFASNSITPLSVQLGEVKAICDVLFNAKVNSLDNIRRERVSTDDNTGQLTDYFDKKSVTDELAILTPYEVTFRSFSAEVANVIAGFASSPYGMLVKSINVEPGPAPTPATEEQQATPQVTYVQNPAAVQNQEGANAAAFQRRYGLGGGGGRYGRGPAQAAPVAQAPQTIYVTPQPGTASAKPQTVLDERQIKVTLGITVVKIKPAATAGDAQQRPGDQSAAQPATEQPAAQN